VDVATAVTFRSGITAIVVAVLLKLQNVPLQIAARPRKVLPAIAALVAVQSLCLYAAVARLPVALALLAFNTYPLWTALWSVLIYRQRAESMVLKAMPILLLGLALALDVFGAASGLGAAAHWNTIGAGVAFALTAAATFGLVLILTQHEAAEVDGRLRTGTTMGMVALIASAIAVAQGGFQLPHSPSGWYGLGGLTFLYGTAFTIMFTLLPRLGVVGNSAIMNVEPVFALVMAWLLLGQTIEPVQVAGALIVVVTVMILGLRRSK
jgi:drug/metabolite transporter (DMT)-like permease